MEEDEVERANGEPTRKKRIPSLATQAKVKEAQRKRRKSDREKAWRKAKKKEEERLAAGRPKKVKKVVPVPSPPPIPIIKVDIPIPKSIPPMPPPPPPRPKPEIVKPEIPKVVIPQVQGPLTKEQIKDLKAKQAYLIKMRDDNKIFHFREGDFIYPNPDQKKLLEAWNDPRWKVFAFCGSNQRGKTTIACIIGFAVMFGEWPWSGEKIFFPHDDPRVVVYVGQQWLAHIQRVVEPELMKWWPKHRGPVDKITRKNNEGIRAHWVDPVTKSELFVCSNWQDTITFEGFKADLIIWDEPPRRENRVAATRGLMARAGKELFVATIIGQPWMQREIIKGRNDDGTINNSIHVITGDIFGNVSQCRCGKYILRIIKENGVTYGICETCGKVKDFEKRGLTLEGVQDYKSKLKKKEIAYRIDGGSDTESLLILPSFDRVKQGRKRPAVIPRDWVVDISIDFHPSKPWAVLFCGTDQRGFKWFFDSMHKNGSPKNIAEEIIKKIQSDGYVLNSIEIDPLAKGDSNAHEGNYDDDDITTVYTIMGKIFSSCGYELGTASKDKANGIKILEGLMMTENEIPGCFVYDDMSLLIQQWEDWMKDEETGLPSKKEPDEFCELAYRIALKNTVWYPRESNDSGGDVDEEHDPLGRG